MGSISSALSSASSALNVYESAFNVIENNITNANTPGYALQTLPLEAAPFNPATGLAGGVEAGPLLNSRAEYLEQGVRDQQQALGYSQQLAGDLGQVQPLFDLTSGSGVANSLDSLFNAFSGLTVNPNDEVSRQAVITAAGTLAQNINQSAAGIQQVSTNATSQTATVVTQINQLASQITGGQLGALIQESNTTLPGYTANLNTLAQSLADTVNTTLADGVDANGAAGAPLFSYDQASDAASTIAVTGITPDQIAAASAAAPGGNGNAVALTALATTPEINGFTFTQSYGNLGSQVGSDVASAQQDQTQAQDQLTQAQAQRSNLSGVDLNTEAAQLLQYQQAYQAVGKLVSVLQGLTTTIIDAVQATTA